MLVPASLCRRAILTALAIPLTLMSREASAQGVLGKIKIETEKAKRAIRDVNEIKKDGTSVVDNAKALSCSTRGTTCADVTVSESFKPRRYSILAVALAARGGSGQVNLDQLVRDAFESAIVRKGFTAAPGADVTRIQQRLDQVQGNSEAKQAQLKDFAESIDAVLMVEAANPEVSRCESTQDGRRVYGQQVSVKMSARWLNTDSPDIPWMATHRVSTCDTKGNNALSDALSQLAIELANAIPERVAKPSGK